MGQAMDMSSYISIGEDIWGPNFATIGEGMACESGDSRGGLSKTLGLILYLTLSKEGHMSEIQLDFLMLPCFGV